MLKTYLANRTIRIALWVVAALIVVGFMWLTTPKRPAPLEQAANQNSLVAPSPSEPAPLPGPAAPSGAVKPTVPGAPPAAPAPSPIPKKNTNTKAAGFAEKRTPHFVSANVTNNATLTGFPATISITFDTALKQTTESFITVKRDQIYSATAGSSYISADGRMLSVNLNPQVMDGEYYVYYVACFADTGCSDGRFGYHLRLP